MRISAQREFWKIRKIIINVLLIIFFKKAYSTRFNCVCINKIKLVTYFISFPIKHTFYKIFIMICFYYFFSNKENHENLKIFFFYIYEFDFQSLNHVTYITIILTLHMYITIYIYMLYFLNAYSKRFICICRKKLNIYQFDLFFAWNICFLKFR